MVLVVSSMMAQWKSWCHKQLIPPAFGSAPGFLVAGAGICGCGMARSDHWGFGVCVCIYSHLSRSRLSLTLQGFGVSC